MKIGLRGVVVVVGNYGSGKTEVSINLAVHCREAGLHVRIADLDLINPYFRTREVARTLTRMGIQVVLPPEPYLQADLPILSPMIAGMIRDPNDLTVLDVGGDDAGATVLASLADAFENRPVHMLMVTNPFRPATSTVAGCLRISREIEEASRMAITGLVGNANLMEETAPEHIYGGYELVRAFSEARGLPVVFVTVERRLLPGIDLAQFPCPVLPIVRQLLPPWKRVKDL